MLASYMKEKIREEKTLEKMLTLRARPEKSSPKKWSFNERDSFKGQEGNSQMEIPGNNIPGKESTQMPRVWEALAASGHGDTIVSTQW